jgi:hypothetical protein
MSPAFSRRFATSGELWQRVLVLLLAVASLEAQEPPATAVRSLAGRVAAADTGLALRRARIAITSGGGRVEPVFSDDEGGSFSPV